MNILQNFQRVNQQIDDVCMDALANYDQGQGEVAVKNENIFCCCP